MPRKSLSNQLMDLFEIVEATQACVRAGSHAVTESWFENMMGALLACARHAVHLEQPPVDTARVVAGVRDETRQLVAFVEAMQGEGPREDNVVRVAFPGASKRQLARIAEARKACRDLVDHAKAGALGPHVKAFYEGDTGGAA